MKLNMAMYWLGQQKNSLITRYPFIEAILLTITRKRFWVERIKWNVFPLKIFAG